MNLGEFLLVRNCYTGRECSFFFSAEKSLLRNQLIISPYVSVANADSQYDLRPGSDQDR